MAHTRDLSELERLQAENRHLRQLLAQNAAPVLRRSEPEQRDMPAPEAVTETILERITEAVLALDTDWRITYINAEAARINGKAPHAFLGKTHWEEWPATVGTVVEQEYRRALREQVTVQFEHHYQDETRDIWLEISAYPSPVGLTLIYRDITHRKQMETQLLAAEAQLRLIVDAAPVLIGCLDCHHRYRFVNQGYARSFGKEPPDVIGQHVRDLLGEDAYQQVLPAIEAALRGESVTFERELVVAGTLRSTLTTYVPDYDAQGNVSGLVGTITDITERKRAEADLQEEARATETLNRVGRMLAAELDLDRLMQVLTDEATALCGAQFGSFFYNTVDAQGRGMTLYTLSGAPREAFACFPLPRATDLFGPTLRGESIVRSGDITQDPRYGKHAPYYGMPQGHLPVRSYLALPVRSRSGEVLGGLFFGHADTGVFTERHERLVVGVAAQAAIAIDNARLYQRAQQEIAERVQAQKVLEQHAAEIEALNQQITRAIRETHHRVKNNLQVIAAMVDMQALEHEAAEAVPLAEFTRIGTHVRTLAVVHDLLTNSLRQEEEDQRLSAAEVLQRLLPLLQPTAGTYALHTQVEDAQLTSKQCIALALVTNELVSNAFKHGGTAATLLFTCHDGTGELAVSDNGRGFPGGFDPLVAANTGLQLVETITRTDLGGAVMYQNRGGGGANVTAIFPLPVSQ